MGAAVKLGRMSNEARWFSHQANQYALTRLIDAVIGAPPLRQAGNAADVVPLLGVAR
jgi:hypothetical protein